MSYHKFSIIQGRAVTDKRVTNAQLRTLSALGMYADKDGWCFPSQSTIGEDLGKSRQTVNEDIAALTELGYVEKDSVTLPGNQIRMRYRLIYDRIPTGGVSENRQGVSEYPDSNDPMNDPNNTGNKKPVPVAPCSHLPTSESYICLKCQQIVPAETKQELPIEWQIVAGNKITSMPDNKDAQYKDSANLIAQGSGSLESQVFNVAYAFMATRGIIIPSEDAKGNRSVAKVLVKAGVQPHDIVDAVRYMLEKKLTCTDLYSVKKIALSLANPAPGQDKSQPQTHSKFEGV